MKPLFTLLIVVNVMLSTGCNNKVLDGPATSQSASDSQTTYNATDSDITNISAANISGTVIDTADAGDYTYVQVEAATANEAGVKEKFWAAAPKFAVKTGDKVLVPEGLPMKNHHSKTLDRTFDVIYFVDGVTNETTPNKPLETATTKGDPHSALDTSPPSVDFSDVKPAKDGHSIAHLFDNSKTLSNTKVAVRGKVVKFTAQVMGKNWLHIQDGSAAQNGSKDLTVTTQAAAKIGDIVLVNGSVSTNKDFGYGYHYDVIIEDATVALQ